MGDDFGPLKLPVGTGRDLTRPQGARSRAEFGRRSQLRQFSGEENIQHFDGVRGDRRKPSHLQLHCGAQGGIRDLGQPRQPKGACLKAPGLVCAAESQCGLAVVGRIWGRALGVASVSEITMPPSGAGLNTRKSKQRVAATWGYSFRIRTPSGR